MRFWILERHLFLVKKFRRNQDDRTREHALRRFPAPSNDTVHLNPICENEFHPRREGKVLSRFPGERFARRAGDNRVVLPGIRPPTDLLSFESVLYFRNKSKISDENAFHGYSTCARSLAVCRTICSTVSALLRLSYRFLWQARMPAARTFR